MAKYFWAALGLLILAIEPASAAVSSFDAEAATKVYLDTVQGAAREKSDAYYEGGSWLILWNMIVTVLVAWGFLVTGWSAKIGALAKRITKWRWLQPALYAVPYVLLSSLITLPWSLYTDYYREKKYDLMNQSLDEWFGEQMIGMAISLIIVTIFAIIVFAVIRRFQKSWWLIGAGVSAVTIMFMAMIAPVFIAPLFNEYTQMEEGPLRDEIVAMAKSKNVPSENIYVFNQSKQHDRISANVSGFGSTMRISLNDNLLNDSSPAEVKAVMGHELGHYVLGHVWRSIIIMSLILTLAFFLLAKLTPRILAKHGEKWGVKSVDDPAVVPLFSIIFTVYFTLMTPVTYSLTRINESEADAFGLDVAKEPDGFASISMKLSQYRKVDPGALEEMLLHHHPSGATRVRMSMAWKAAHLDEIKAEREPEGEPKKAEASVE